MDRTTCKLSRLGGVRGYYKRRRRSHKSKGIYLSRRIVKLLDGGNALNLPLVQLDCGHQVRTNGIRRARCTVREPHRPEGNRGKECK